MCVLCRSLGQRLHALRAIWWIGLINFFDLGTFEFLKEVVQSLLDCLTYVDSLASTSTLPASVINLSLRSVHF